MSGWTRPYGESGRGAAAFVVAVFVLAALGAYGYVLARHAQGHHHGPHVSRVAELAAVSWDPLEVSVWLDTKRASVDAYAEWQSMVDALTNTSPGPFTSNADVTVADVDNARRASLVADRHMQETRALIGAQVARLTQVFAGERADAMVLTLNETAAVFLADVANDLSPLPGEQRKIDRTIAALSR